MAKKVMKKKKAKKSSARKTAVKRAPAPVGSVLGAARIRVFGVGGSGGNAVNYMIKSGLGDVDFIVGNTDLQDLNKTKAMKKIHLGAKLSQGLGAGMNPAIGEQAANEAINEIREAIAGSDILFIACGMGGGTGTGAAPVIAKAAQELGILTICVVTKPFSFEGQKRRELADEGLQRLRKHADSLVTIPNDTVLAISTEGTSLSEAFAKSDEVLYNAVSGITHLITRPGDINIDFADVAAIMRNSGRGLIGIGKGRGPNKVEVAITRAIASPLLEDSLRGSRRVLYSITSRTRNEITMKEVQAIAERIQEQVSPDAKIIFGTSTDRSMRSGEVSVTVIATDHGNGNSDAYVPQKVEEYEPVAIQSDPEPPKKNSGVKRLSDFDEEHALEDSVEYIDGEESRPLFGGLRESFKNLWRKK